MKKTTPLILLITTTLAWSIGLSGCTPNNDSKAATPGEIIQEDSIEKVSEQEAALESVGLKFIVNLHEHNEQEITFVLWDSQLRQEWLETHAAEDIVLQIEELEKFIQLAELEVEETEDESLQLKLNLAELTLNQLN